MKSRSVMLCLFILIFSTTFLFAQSATEKGRIITDVNFGLNSGDLEIDDAFDTEVSHSVLDALIGISYTVIDDLAIGLIISLDNESVDTKNDYYDSKTTESTMLYLVHARYFLMPEQAIRPFVMVEGGLGTGKTTVTGAEDMKSKITVFGGGIGVAYFINQHVGVELRGLYQIQNISDNDNHDSSSDISGTGIHIALGTIVSF